MRRWAEVFAAAMFINTSYGTLSYAFSVLVTRSAAGGTFGPGTVALGFAAALLVSGVVSIGTGTVADLFGSRRLMASGSVLGAAGLVLLSACQEGWQAIAVMSCVLGPAMAATFYEPVYVLMNRWFAPRERPRAYGVLTLLSGFSITIYTPLTRWWVDALGWRGAVVALAGCLLAVGLAVPALVREPAVARDATTPLSPRAFLREMADGVRQGNARFWAFSFCFFAATTAFSGYSFHMISQLESRGFDETSVASAIAITGVVSLPLRLVLPMLSGRAPGAALLAVCLSLLAVAAWLATAAEHWWQVWAFIALFGAVFGAVYPLRALVTAERFAGPYFGRLIGVQALLVAVGRAAGPALIAAYGTDRGAYLVSFRAAGVVLLVSALGVWLTMRTRRPPVTGLAPLGDR